MPEAPGIRCAVKPSPKSVVREGAADKAAIQLVEVQPCQLPVLDR